MMVESRRMHLGIVAGFLAGAATIYVAILLGLVVFQRHMMYFPAGERGSAASYDLADTKTLQLRTADGETIAAWYHPAAKGRPLYLYFHGNGGTLAIRADWLRRLTADGSGVLAIDYRGYGGSTGSPSETGLIHDGEAAYAEARRLGYAPRDIVIIGESLGTSVAIAVAAAHPIRALVLDSAFTSAADIAAARYWMFPVRLLMKDPFDSAARIEAVDAPKLFLHATGDPVTPLVSARRLFAKASEPKTFVEIPDIGHMVLGKAAALDRMKTWLATVPLAPSGDARDQRRPG